jgi:hypothetical protein
VDVADLGHEDGRQHRTHAGDGLDGQVADITGLGESTHAQQLGQVHRVASVGLGPAGGTTSGSGPAGPA